MTELESSAETSVPCHACGARGLRVFSESRALPAVASDCRPWPSNYELARCRECGLVQKCHSASWQAEIQRIYASYALYHQTADGSEQVIFDQTSGVGRARSELMFEALQQRFALPTSGRFLDLGCGTGPTLRAFSKLMSGWQLYGYDPHLPERQAVLKIPGVVDVYAGELAHVPGPFDLVTAVHVLEHVPAPLEFLKNLRRLMGANSLALVQVPYFPETPFDLTVFDHCSHFTEQSLGALFRLADLHVELISTELLPKEISVVARRAPRSQAEANATAAAGALPLQSSGAPATALAAEQSEQSEQSEQAVEQCLSWLSALRAQALTDRGAPLGAFGTSIGGNWLLGLLGSKLQFFVDEDPKRLSSDYRGRPVYAPAAVPPGSQVLMPLPPTIALKIRERLRPQHFELVLPPASWHDPKAARTSL